MLSSGGRWAKQPAEVRQQALLQVLTASLGNNSHKKEIIAHCNAVRNLAQHLILPRKRQSPRLQRSRGARSHLSCQLETLTRS